MISLQQLKTLQAIYQHDMAGLTKRVISSAFHVHRLKVLETGTPWQEDSAYLAWMQDQITGDAYCVGTESFRLQDEDEQRWGYSICRCSDKSQSSEDVEGGEDGIVWRMVNPLTLTAYPMHAAPKIEFPREDEYCPAVPHSLLDLPCGKADYLSMVKIS